MFKKSITLKLALGFITIVIISMLILGTISINIYKNNIYQIKRNNMTKHASNVSGVIEPYIFENKFNDEYKSIIKVIDSFTNSKVWVVNSERKIYTPTNNKDINSSLDNPESVKQYDSLINKALSGNNASGELYNPYYGEYMMTVAVPVKSSNGSIIGAVLLHSSISDISRSMDNFFIYLLVALLGEITLAGFMGYYFSKNISKPIKVINASALEMARGKYGIKTNIYQRDEIGELSNSFDLLSLKLEHTINQLYDEKTKLSNIITSMNEGIIALDNNFEVINVNQSALNLLSANKLSEKSGINDLLSSLNITDQLKSVMESGEKTSVVKKLGDLIINLSISPITGSSNETTGTVILIQDISQKEKLEQMRRDFISNVSHEFRTPLTVIRGNLESIIDGVIDTHDINESCKTILNETSRLERMVKDLLDLSRLESGRFELNLQDIDVNSVVNDTIRGLKQIWSNKNISIKKDLYDNIPPVSSDYDRLKQLLIIFLDNSIKFSEKNSEIEIKTSYENNFISLKVTDHGPGIPEGSIQYLGERFYKADISRASNVSGTGLGLSIAKNIVKILNGDFKIESSPGEGTTVTVYLPVIKI